jgi:hypothetical protein
VVGVGVLSTDQVTALMFHDPLTTCFFPAFLVHNLFGLRFFYSGLPRMVRFFEITKALPQLTSSVSFFLFLLLVSSF